MKLTLNPLQIIGEGEYKPFNSYSRSVLRINVTETANFTCYAMNQMTGGRQSHDQKSFMVYVKTDEDSSGQKGAGTAASKGYCALYNGQVCRKYLNGRGLVFYNVSQDNSGGWLNEKITSDIWHEHIEKLDEPCKSAAEVRPLLVPLFVIKKIL